jgi:predicted transporter
MNNVQKTKTLNIKSYIFIFGLALGAGIGAAAYFDD